MHWKDWYWSWNSNTLATWCKELTHWKRPRCWERLKAGEGGDREWVGWMASPTQWTWVWVGSGSWWWTEKSGMVQSMGSLRVRHDWATKMNWAGPEPTKFLCPWDSPGKDNEVSCDFPSPGDLCQPGVQLMSLSLLLWEVICLFVCLILAPSGKSSWLIFCSINSALKLDLLLNLLLYANTVSYSSSANCLDIFELILLLLFTQREWYS